jgi:hypothetical protein
MRHNPYFDPSTSTLISAVTGEAPARFSKKWEGANAASQKHSSCLAQWHNQELVRTCSSSAQPAAAARLGAIIQREANVLAYIDRFRLTFGAAIAEVLVTAALTASPPVGCQPVAGGTVMSAFFWTSGQIKVRPDQSV